MQGNDEPIYGYEEPIPFLEILENEHGDVEFQLSPKSEDYLRRMTNKKVAVLTIAGPQRSGKSFLANRFLKKMAGFAIGPTTNPCTKGIWLWGKPISLNSEVDLLIMDTEGLNSTQRDQTIDMKIFSISILLSSYFMYNSFGHIDENALENLSLVVHLSEHINISSQATSENDYAKYFPYFHWVLRDFSLDLKGRSSNQYLEAALQVVQGADQDKQKKNNIRNKIKNYFKARECTTLVRPLNDESKLAYIEKQRWDELRPEFREDVEYLVNNVLASIGPKIIQGKPLTGEMILNLTKSYLQALNTGGVPQILTSLERVVSSEMKRIYDTLVKEYMSMIESTFHEKALPMPEDELLKKHKEITTHILKKLTTSGEIIGHKEVSMIQQKIALGFEKTLKGKMDMNAEKISALSQKAISNFGSKLPIPHAADLKEGFAEIVPKLVTPFKDTFQQFYQVFKNGLQGSNKKFSIFSDMMPKIIMDYYDKVVQVCEQVKDEEVQDMQKKLEQAREGEAALRQILEDNQSLLSQLKSEKNEIRGEYEKMKEELNEVMDAADREKDRLKFELKKMSITLESAKKEDTGGRSNEADLLEEVEILKEQNKFYKREMDRQKESISALKEALEAARSTPQVTEVVATKPAKNGNKLRGLDVSDDDDIHDSPQVQELYEKIFTLESRIKELEATGLGLTEIDITNPNGTQEDVEPEEVLLDDSQIVEDQLLGLCHNEELKGKVKILFTNYNRQKILFQKKLGTLFFENNKLKAEIIDYNKKLESLPKKDELIESLRKEVKSLNASLNGQAGGMSEGSLEFQLAQLKSDSLRISGEKENLLYFMKELILKMKKKKNHHYEHAFSSLPEQDQIDIRNIFNEIGFKP